MKRNLIILPVLLLMVSCNNAHKQTPNMEGELEKIIVRQEKMIDSLQAEVCRLSVLLDKCMGE